jgi:hypothetical protein
MTAICITGLHRETLQAAARLLQAAGMETARAPERGGSMDIHAWHAQVVSRAGRDPASLQAPGRLWEQLAADILVANLASPCWGWAEPLSVPLLGFWRTFEPQMRFVLVCETLDDLIARHVEEEQPPEALEAAIAQWHEGHEAMLRFHLRNAQVSQMVWGHTMVGTSGTRLLKTWSTHWNLPLAAGQDIGAPVAPTSSLGAGNPLIAFLAQRVLREHPATQALAEELAASIPAFGDDALAVAELNPSVSALVAGIRALRANAAMQAALAEAEQAKAELDKQMLRQTQLQQDAGALRKAKDALQAERDEVAKEKGKSEAARKEAEAESELILQQLHQVQEELERQFLANQSAQLRADQLEARSTRLMASMPGAVDCQPLQLVAGGKASESWRWRAAGLVAAGHQRQSLEFETVTERGVTGIVLTRTPGKVDPLLRWPLSARSANTLNLAPVANGEDGNKQLALLAQLSSSDWDITQVLLRQMQQYLVQGGLSLPADEVSAKVRAIARAQALMRPLQDVLRFDAIHLDGQQANAIREVLALRLTHLTWRGQRLPSLALQLQAQPAAAAEGNPLAGPVHLIFGRETALAPFETWTGNAKAGDKRQVMAIPLSAKGPLAPVWDTLTVADRQLLAGLIDALPLALALLHIQNTKLPRAWKDWVELAKALRQWVRMDPTVTPEPSKPAKTRAARTLIPTEAPRRRAVRPTRPSTSAGTSKRARSVG